MEKVPASPPLPSSTLTCRPRLSSGTSTGLAIVRSATHRPPRATSGRIAALQREASFARTLSRGTHVQFVGERTREERNVELRETAIELEN